VPDETPKNPSTGRRYRGVPPPDDPHYEAIIVPDDGNDPPPRNGRRTPLQDPGILPFRPPPFRPPPAPQPAPRFKLTAFKEIVMSTVSMWLVQYLIPRVGLIVVWGAAKSGKSFWTFDLCMHIALGWRYRDRRVHPGVVVYCALEGGLGFAKRVEAWRREYLKDHSGEVPFYLIDTPMDLVREHGLLIAAIAAQLGDTAPAVITIDTLNRALAGSENRPEDMSAFVKAADALRVAFNCAVVIVHHCGVEGSRPRGHTSLSGADDAQIGVQLTDQDVVTATIDHMKDGPAGASFTSRLVTVDLGKDDDGEPITSCVIEPAEAGTSTPPKKLSPAAKLALRELSELLADDNHRRFVQSEERIPRNVPVVSKDAWRENFYNASAGKRDTLKHGFNRASQQLQLAGIVGVWKDWAWLAGHGTTAGQDRDMSRSGIPNRTGTQKRDISPFLKNGECPVARSGARSRKSSPESKTAAAKPVTTPKPPPVPLPEGWQVLGLEASRPCEQCGKAADHDSVVYLIRNRSRMKSHVLHEGCAAAFKDREEA
jgi:hypothetical protein